MEMRDPFTEIVNEANRALIAAEGSTLFAAEGSTLFFTRGGFSRVHTTQSFARSMYCRDLDLCLSVCLSVCLLH
jgi:hypothetical protein